MTEPNMPSASQSPENQANEISPETKAFVDQKMPNESDEIRYHTMSLIEAIKKQTQSQLESAGEMTREAYVTAMRQAQDTLRNTGVLMDEQRESLETMISGVEDKATQNWENLVSDLQKLGDRVERAVNAAWTILTESESQSSSDSSSDSENN